MTNSVDYLATSVEAARLRSAERQFEPVPEPSEDFYPLEVVRRFKVFEVALPSPAFLSKEMSLPAGISSFSKLIGFDRYFVWAEPHMTEGRVLELLRAIVLPF